MFLAIIIFLLILFTQLSTGIVSWLNRNKMAKKYAFILSELIEPAKTLENYIKIYRKVNLRVNGAIDEPAYAEKDFLILKRERMYSPDLYSNFYTIFQLELTKVSNNFIRNIYKYQNLLFFLEILLFIIGVIISPSIGIYFIYFALFIQVILLILTFLGFMMVEGVLNESHLIAQDLLNLDDVEIARALSLQSELKFKVFEYPFEIVWRIWQFVKP